MNNEETLRKKILDTIKSVDGKKLRRRQLYNLIKVKSLPYEDFKSTMTELEKEGAILRLKGRKFVLPEENAAVAGVFSLTKNGNGYVDFSDRPSVFVKRDNIGDAMNGDKVLVRISKRKPSGDFPQSGVIIKVIERSSKPIVGIYKKQRGSAYLMPCGGEFPGNLPVLNNGGTGADDGDLVVCKLGGPVKGFSQPVCEVTEVLGDPDAPGVDVLAIANAMSCQSDFRMRCFVNANKYRTISVPRNSNTVWISAILSRLLSILTMLRISTMLYR